MKLISSLTLFLLVLNFASISEQTGRFNGPIINYQTIFEEKDSIVAIAAEYFYKQSQSKII